MAKFLTSVLIIYIIVTAIDLVFTIPKVLLFRRTDDSFNQAIADELYGQDPKTAELMIGISKAIGGFGKLLILYCIIPIANVFTLISVLSEFMDN